MNKSVDEVAKELISVQPMTEAQKAMKALFEWGIAAELKRNNKTKYSYQNEQKRMEDEKDQIIFGED